MFEWLVKTAADGVTDAAIHGDWKEARMWLGRLASVVGLMEGAESAELGGDHVDERTAD